MKKNFFLVLSSIIISLFLIEIFCNFFFFKKVDYNYKNRYLIFSEGIDFIYESFNSKGKIKSNLIDRTVKFIGKNKFINRYFIKIADTGFNL